MKLSMESYFETIDYPETFHLILEGIQENSKQVCFDIEVL